MAEAETDSAPSGRVSQAAAAFAARAGIDLNAALETAVEDKTVAEHNKQALREALPEVPSVYQPSGTLPLTAIVAMTIGILVSTPLSLVAGALLALVGGLLASGDLKKLHGKAKIVPLLGMILLAVVVPVTGFLAALGTIWFSRLGKNRSPGGAAIFAAGSAAVAMGLAWSIFQLHGKEHLDKAFRAQPGDLDTVYLVVALLGAPVAIVGGGLLAYSAISQEKFCESCETYMQQEALPGLQLGGTLALAKALAEKNLPIAVDLFEAPAGALGKPTLFSCPRCGQGYLELNVHFKAAWTAGETSKEETSSWLVASVELSDASVNRFKLLPRKIAQIPDEPPPPQPQQPS